MSTSALSSNIARHLGEMAARQPDAPALKVPRGRTSGGDIDYLALNFAELEIEVDAWCDRLVAGGLRPGDRSLLMVRPGLPLIACAFAMFKRGVVPVVIDPGMGLRSFLGCVRRSRPTALVGIPFAQIVSRIFPSAFASVSTRIAASGSLTARLATPTTPPRVRRPIAVSAPHDLAAVLFTSGSTGAPKGVCYEHAMFEAQVRLIRDTYGIEPGEIDLPMLPIFALFNPALGMTTVVPEIDPRRPAAVDPAKIVQAIQQENVTNSFGSPTLWRKIGDHCLEKKITLPSLRRVLCAGAPVPEKLWSSSRLWMPRGRLHSPYGATEALPIATISSDEILAAPQSQRGACVGHAVPEIEIKIIVITDAPIATIADAHELTRGEIGEIIVRGPVVTRRYDAAPEATALAKLETRNAKLETGDGAAAVWHRMGDCGYLDAEGRLWYCGRKAERVETGDATLFTEPCEQSFRTHPRVERCALIGLGERGRQRPAIVIEARPGDADACRGFARELRQLARLNAATQTIVTFYFHPRFPVDVRHNAKIHRLALARWADNARAYDGESEQ